jgi:signal transduction histidine kinase
VDNSINQEIAQLIFAGTVVMLLLALALVAFFLLYQKKLTDQQLHLQTIRNTYQQDLLMATIQAEERERARIGNDLHDGIGSSLAAAKMLLAQLAYSAAATAQEQQVVATVEGILTNSLHDIRSISQNLHPAVLAKLGLGQALHNLGSTCTHAFANGLEVQVALAVALPEAQELALYRIVQEAISNALKHAQASRMQVHLHTGHLGLTLIIRDDGCGFDYGQVQARNTAGLGLKSLAARASLLNATLHLESAPGQGTSVQLTMPLPGS